MQVFTMRYFVVELQSHSTALQSESKQALETLSTTAANGLSKIRTEVNGIQQLTASVQQETSTRIASVIG